MDLQNLLYTDVSLLAQPSRYLAWGVPSNEQNIFSAVDITRQKERRRETASLYQWDMVVDYENPLDRLTQELMKRLSDFASSGEVAEINHWFHYYALDAIGIIAVSYFLPVLSLTLG